nr:leucyl/phenylalanyl-tRNA--protein transferase [Granulicoccus phenolivorans]
MINPTDPDTWPDQDLVFGSEQMDPPAVLEAYRLGLFPMPLDEYGFVGWFSPMERGILPLDGLRVTRSLRKMIKRYRVSVDQDFRGVVQGCADPHREGRWIDTEVTEVYTALHEAGYAHSVEVWNADDVLVGGLYGISVGGLFAGESMFHHPELGRDASKVALVTLVELLRASGPEGRLLDVQWQTDHLASLGVIEVTRADYLDLLEEALTVPPPCWDLPGRG